MDAGTFVRLVSEVRPDAGVSAFVVLSAVIWTAFVLGVLVWEARRR